jgi:transcription antitermination factor NusG
VQQLTVARAGDGPQWYVIHTRSQHEKSVARQLEEQGITFFLPLVSEVHRWSDRKKVVQLPLFSCYAFVHMKMLPELWYTVMQTSGVLRFVGASEAAPIADSEIESIRQLLSSKLPYTLSPSSALDSGSAFMGVLSRALKEFWLHAMASARL